jgi:hypothetical protein
MPNIQNETKTVSWFIAKKALIKFEGEEDSRNICDKVMAVSNFEKYPILKGDTVEVGFKDEEVAFLRKVKGVKKSFAKKETKSTPVDISDAKEQQVRIFAVAGNKKVLKFEKDGDWIPISTELQEKDFSALGLVAGNNVTVRLSDGTIVGVENVSNESPVETNTDNESKSATVSSSARRNSFRDEDSTDKRTASMNAKDVVVALLNNKEIDKSKVQSAIEDLTKVFYNTTKNI